MKLNKLFAGVAVATIALSAMAVTVGAEAAAETTLALETTTSAAVAETTAAATNPTTGNAPIALVAIPAAIAAAAIVAKKAK